MITTHARSRWTVGARRTSSSLDSRDSGLANARCPASQCPGSAWWKKMHNRTIAQTGQTSKQLAGRAG